MRDWILPLVAGLSFGAALALAVAVVRQSGRVYRLERDLRSIRKRVMFVEDRVVLGVREVAR